MKTFILLIFLSIFSISYSQQKTVVQDILKIKENKFLYGENLYNGFVVTYFENKHPKTLFEVKEGIAKGKMTEYRYNDSYNYNSFKDTSEINKLNIIINNKTKELEGKIQDTLKSSKEQKDFLNYEIGGYKNLLKLIEKNEEGKLNKNKKEIFDKYEQLVIKNNQNVSKLNDLKNAISSLSNKLNDESNKIIYTPIKLKEYEQVNFIKDGKGITYDSLGNKFGEGKYISDLQNGKWIYIFKNGKKFAEGNFINGNESNKGFSGVPKNGREGIWTFFYENGNKEQVSNYTKGKLNGEFFHYFENGNKKDESNYINDKLNGPKAIYFENGNKSEETNYINDKLNGARSIYFENGNKKETGYYSDGKENGIFTFYDYPGIKSIEITYKDGKKIGKQIIFHKNGKMSEEYFVTNDNLVHGIKKIYNENGILIDETNYESGKINGISKVFYESGKIKSNITLHKNRIHGPMETYYENGKINLKGTIDSTSLAIMNLLGDFFEYNEDGSIKVHGFAKKDGTVEDKNTSNVKTKVENNLSQKELKKPYKCKCCKATINGLSEGIGDDGSDFNNWKAKISFTMFNQDLIDSYQLIGINYVEEYGIKDGYDLLRKQTYPFCSLKCSRLCN